MELKYITEEQLKNLIKNNDPTIWTAYLIERSLDTDEGVSEKIYYAMYKVVKTMPEGFPREYIEYMLYWADATDGFFYLKSKFDTFFGSEFMTEEDWKDFMDEYIYEEDL